MSNIIYRKYRSGPWVVINGQVLLYWEIAIVESFRLNVLYCSVVLFEIGREKFGFVNKVVCRSRNVQFPFRYGRFL